MKREDVLRPFVVQNGEVLLLQSTNRRAGLVGDLNLEFDLPLCGGGGDGELFPARQAEVEAGAGKSFVPTKRLARQKQQKEN